MTEESPKLKREVIKPKIGRRIIAGDRWDNIERPSTARSQLRWAELFLNERGLDKSKLRVLELGSGNAVFLQEAKKHGFNNIVGVDVEPRGDVQDSQVLARIEQLPFPDNHFDVMFSNTIFDHRLYDQDLLAMTAEILRVLKPGGLYFPNEGQADITFMKDFTIVNQKGNTPGTERSLLVLQKSL